MADSSECREREIASPSSAHWRDYLELTKPRITWLILMSTAVGYFYGLGGTSAGWTFLSRLNWLGLLNTMMGTALIASGTAALNQWFEREADRKMRRTAQRPLPTGRLASGPALLFGIALSVGGFVELWWGVNLLAGLIGAFTLFSYLFLYTPLKQRTWWSTAVGAVPGAMPPVIGYAAAGGALTRESWVLFAILFLWQFPHFYSIAWMYKDDYARGGTGWPLDGPPDCAVRRGVDTSQFAAGIVGNGGAVLLGGSIAARAGVPVFRRAGGAGAVAGACARRADGVGGVFAAALWPDAPG